MITLLALLLQIPVALLGVFLVPALLPFERMVQNAEGRTIWRLPKIGFLFDNIYDGALGDKRNWWRDNCSTEAWFGWFPELKNTDFLARYWWMAIRNPINNFKRNIAGADCTLLKVIMQFHIGTKLIDADVGSRGLSFIRFSGGYWAFTCSFDYGNGRGFYVQIGHKVSIADLTKYAADDLRRMKGVTFEMNPYKTFGESL
jgi:hypothetical protein